MTKHYIISGGAGFLGSALCNKLSQDGNHVVAFDNFSRKSHLPSLNKDVVLCNGDVRKIQDLQFAVKHHGPFDELWHFAYINGTSTFYSHPELVLDVGVKGAINTLDVSLSNNIKNYMLASTSEVYNQPTQVPTPETERILIPDVHNPRFSYSGGKIISELLTIHYGARQGLNTKIVRPHNIYGPNMGQEHVVAQITKKIVIPDNPQYDKGRLIVNIQGTGLETRSFCFINDAVEEIILVGKTENSELAPIYNIGVEDEKTISELVHIIANILGVKIIINTGEKTEGSTNRRCPSMYKLNNLGYKPQYSLYDGLKKTIKWYKEFFEKDKNE
jgi:nucleoside-diphosphate-sugar epimerase